MSHAPSHPPPASVGGGVKGLVGNVIVVVALLLAFYFGYQEYQEWDADQKVAAAKLEKERQAALQVQLRTDGGADLKFRRECFTPCAFRADWPWELDGAGYDIEVQPEGHPAYKFSGQGSDPIRIPVAMEYGTLVNVTSLHSEVKRVKVRIYERIR